MGAIVKITGAIDVRNVVGLKGTKPDTSLVVNYGISLTPVAQGKLGELVLFDPARALYESSDGSPTFGQAWGVEPGSWKLRKGRYGFEIQGFAEDGKVLACPIPIRSFAAKVSSTLGKINGSDQPGSGTATLWYFNGSAYVASTITATVKNFTETDIASGKLHKYTLTNGVWAADRLGGGTRLLKCKLNGALATADSTATIDNVTSFSGETAPSPTSAENTLGLAGEDNDDGVIVEDKSGESTAYYLLNVRHHDCEA